MEVDPHLPAHQEVLQVHQVLAHLQAKVEVSVLVVQLRVQEVTAPLLPHLKQVIQLPHTVIMEQ